MSSPKATLHKLYLHSEQQPRYETVSVLVNRTPSDDASGTILVRPLALQPGGFRCTLFVPNCLPVTSDVFPRKREAEQDAAKKALEQMGCAYSCEMQLPKVSTPEEKMEALVERIGAVFSEKVIMSFYPFREHFKVAMTRKDGRSGAVPAAALAVLDNRISSLCKSLHVSSENDPLFALAMICEAARRSSFVCCENGYLIKRKVVFTPQFEAEFLGSNRQEEAYSKFKAVYIPSSEDLIVRNIEIDLEPRSYYMDTLARNLGVREGSEIMMSRTIPRAPNDARLYYAIPDIQIIPKSWETPVGVVLQGKNELVYNRRASDLLGYSVYGDAILASVGSTWKSEGKLVFADVSLSCYYRLLLGRTPEGNYKLKRDAILVSKLPNSFSSRAQWRGTLPRSLLIDFCHQHRLADPDFVLHSTNPSSDMLPIEDRKGSNGSYRCRAKIVHQDQVVEFESEHHYRNRCDAIQSAALRALFHLSKKVPTVPHHVQNVQLSPTSTSKCLSLDDRAVGCEPENGFVNGNVNSEGSSNPVDYLNKAIAAGSMVCMSYNVWLVGNGVNMKVEAHEEFEFQIGVGGIIGELESIISGMHIDAYEELLLPVDNIENILATNQETVHDLENPVIEQCSLKYCIKVLRIVEPSEDRMESALFSPPLSKQRNEFALGKIRELNAKSLVDFGCGSGSLLDVVVDQITHLECIAGVDISLKSLLRAAKSLYTKVVLQKNGDEDNYSSKLKKIVLYEGSLAQPDPRLCGFDIATCMEVVEHMDPEPLKRAGDIILGKYAPRTLILSTPNIEYNVLLQKVALDTKVSSGENRVVSSGACLNSSGHFEEPAERSSIANLSDDESNAQSIRLRNDDHRFEWTRSEFQEWANSLALRFGYTVEFSGVGGCAEDPGFATQIAIFTRDLPISASEENRPNSLKAEIDASQRFFPCYREVWKYKKEGFRK
ncbi:hypothetical protein KP509_19G034000 [Ceratopteris richardii]|uniref:Small RNA 2'-O-methyltransferase n=2 Tax=Ceratopteris richardii TaxID=49495 RepID=A0A8T2SK41_CERRI|nr:hypothetical protein KP509_19G034000 [Ceratopteris richardii]KAH7352199.1 hypothetical protein KP509_19G034000 [Ceratopteris richardii]KAH7352203.1 hypothetical protein KP509_19G034000 [Ceratopteris richardii]KAH7352204.1 hypothetical protein KP509_19G034000 [Ceratopteris richardii]